MMFLVVFKVVYHSNEHSDILGQTGAGKRAVVKALRATMSWRSFILGDQNRSLWCLGACETR